MGCQQSSTIISPTISSTTSSSQHIPKKIPSKKRFGGDSKFSISPSVAEAEDMLVDIPDPFKSSYKIIEKISNKNYRKLYTAFSKDKREVIVEFTELSLYLSSGYTEINYFTRLDLLRQFDHQSLPKVIDFFDGKETHRIVFEMASGKDLGYLLKAKGPPKYNMIKPFMLALISVIQYLHKQNVMHQNLKPASIVLAAYGSFYRPEQLKLVGLNYLSQPKILDITSTLSQSHKSTHNSLPICHYPKDDINPYCAPEIKTKNYDLSVDLYSIGAILYTLITGYPPPLPSPTTPLKLGKEWNSPFIQEMGIEPIMISLLSYDPSLRPSLTNLQTFFENIKVQG